MNVHQLGVDLAANAERRGHDLATDLKAECAHIADSVQLFIALFLIADIVGIAVYTTL